MADNTYDFSVDDSYTPNQNFDDSPVDFQYGNQGGYYDFGDGSNYSAFNNQSSNVPMGGQWGDQSYAPGSAMYNILNQTNPEQSLPQTSNYLPEANGTTSNWNMSGIGSTLQSLFNNKGLTSGLAALMEGSQNKKKAAALQQLASQVRQGSDPFAAQRPFYQEQLQRAVSDPYSSPIVANQVTQLERLQAMKDAAAGRRSNSALSNPATLAAASEVAQKYMNNLMTPAGANIAPNASAWSSIAAQGINNDVNGYMSPLASALGYNQQTNNNTQMLEALRSLLSGGK